MDVKSIIKQRGWTMEAVAEQMGVTRVTLSQTLSRNPTIKTLERIAEVIGCRVGDFFLDEVEIPAPSIVCPHCGKAIKVAISAEQA